MSGIKFTKPAIAFMAFVVLGLVASLAAMAMVLSEQGVGVCL